ncbi:class Ib ribonucleoside-diphosphate reductase assembly flavoprotein NrdI [Dysgonomonas sp.]|jgi:protein involved in ribonucleotide reduction
MTIYYDSKTGNVERFIDKVNAITNWTCIKITSTTSVSDFGHLVTYTTKIGSIPDSTSAFMEENGEFILSVSSSGNMNWGDNFARAADKISEKHNVPILIKFELSGLVRDVNNFIQKVKDHANKKMDTPQQ